jgi:hypothetical protein
MAEALETLEKFVEQVKALQVENVQLRERLVRSEKNIEMIVHLHMENLEQIKKAASTVGGATAVDAVAEPVGSSAPQPPTAGAANELAISLFRRLNDEPDVGRSWGIPPKGFEYTKFMSWMLGEWGNGACVMRLKRALGTVPRESGPRCSGGSVFFYAGGAHDKAVAQGLREYGFIPDTEYYCGEETWCVSDENVRKWYEATAAADATADATAGAK